MTSSIQHKKTTHLRKSDCLKLLTIFWAVSLLPFITGCADKMLQTTMAPSFNLSPSASSLQVLPGANASSTISVTGQNGFNSNVALAASDVPSGVTATFSPATTTSQSSLIFAVSRWMGDGSTAAGDPEETRRFDRWKWFAETSSRAESR